MRIHISTSSSKPQTSVDIKISGSEENVQRVLSLLGMIQYNGAVGHSGIFGITWDGDGADNIKIEGPLPNDKDALEATSSYGGYVEFVGERGQFYVVNGKDAHTTKVWPKPGLDHKGK